MTGRGVLRTLLWAALGAAGAWVLWRFLLPCLWPFLLAFLTAAVCEPVVRFLTDRAHLRRGVASALCVLTVLSSLLGFFLLVVVRLVDEALGLTAELPRLASGLTEVLERVRGVLDRAVESAPESFRGYVEAALEATARRASELPAALSEWALGKLSAAAARAPEMALTAATYVIGSFFVSAGFEGLRAFLVRQVPDRLRGRLRHVKEDLLASLGKWLRAEATLLGITFLELTAAFLLLRVEYGAVIALVTALVDALPVFGAGVVLLPWAAVSLLTGGTGRALGLAAAWLTVTLVHSCLEPKLIGDRFGVAPAAALLAMYAGFKLLGVAGMVLFPFALMVLNEMNTKGYVKLWKQAENARSS